MHYQSQSWRPSIPPTIHFISPYLWLSLSISPFSVSLSPPLPPAPLLSLAFSRARTLIKINYSQAHPQTRYDIEMVDVVAGNARRNRGRAGETIIPLLLLGQDSENLLISAATTRNALELRNSISSPSFSSRFVTNNLFSHFFSFCFFHHHIFRHAMRATKIIFMKNSFSRTIQKCWQNWFMTSNDLFLIILKNEFVLVLRKVKLYLSSSERAKS